MWTVEEKMRWKLILWPAKGRTSWCPCRNIPGRTARRTPASRETRLFVSRSCLCPTLPLAPKRGYVSTSAENSTYLYIKEAKRYVLQHPSFKFLLRNFPPSSPQSVSPVSAPLLSVSNFPLFLIEVCFANSYSSQYQPTLCWESSIMISTDCALTRGVMRVCRHTQAIYSDISLRLTLMRWMLPYLM